MSEGAAEVTEEIVRSPLKFVHLRIHTDFSLDDGLQHAECYVEQEDIKEGYAMSYCLNRDYPECSEMGSICFRITKDGGIVREG